MAYEDYCAACTHLGENADYNGNYSCSKRGISINANAAKCDSFCEAYRRSNYARENMYKNSQSHSSSGCYLTTIMCQILKYPDNNFYLNVLRGFRDNIMQKDQKYLPLLMMYDYAGPMIAYELSKDHDRFEIANSFFNIYITKAVLAIGEQKFETAVNIYKSMTEELGKRYNISINLVTPKTTTDDITTLGHGKRKIKESV